MTNLNLQNSRAEGLRFLTGSLGGVRRVLIEDIALLEKDLFIHFLDAGGANRVVVLPPLSDETITRVIHNIGTANSIAVEDSLGAVVTTLSPGEGAFCFGSDQEWIALRSWADLDVFGPSGAGHSVGLVPDPGAIAGAVRFLREDGQWASVHVIGIVDSFKNITDGTNTAVASGPDTFWFRSDDGTIVPTVTNNHATFGDTVNLEVDEAQVDHNLLGNYDPDQHVGHSLVSITGTEGISGGGDLTASSQLALDFSSLASVAPLLTDSMALFDASGGVHIRTTLGTLNTILVHDDLVGFVGNEHINHSLISLIPGEGLSGGGDWTASRSLALNIPSLDVETPVATDLVLFYDNDEVKHATTTWAGINALLNHDVFAGFVGNEHIDHTAVSISPGTGLQGGGTIAANRTLSLADAPAWSLLARYAGTSGIPTPIALADIGVEAAPAAGDFLFLFRADGVPVVVDWSDLPGSGSGNVVGPASSTDNHFALFDGITGELLKDGGAPGAAAFLNVGTGAGTVAAGDHSHSTFPLLSLLTTRGDIPFRDATTWARLAKGTAGQILTMGADDPGWSDPPDGGGWVELVAPTSLPAATSVSITNIPQTYTQLLLRIRGLSSVSAGAHSIQVDADPAGGSFDTTAGNYTGIAILSNGGVFAGNQASLAFLDGSSFAAANSADYEMLISGYAVSMPGIFTTMRVPFTNTYRTSFGMYAGADAPIQALRILAPGNFDGGTYALYAR